MNVESVHATLLGATEAGTRVAAEAQLAELEKHCGAGGGAEGYVTALVSVVCARSEARPAARLMGAICLRNVVRRKWKEIRLSKEAAVSAAEKLVIRNFLVASCLSEEDGLVWAQLLELLKKCARTDWPRQWPDVVSTVFASVDTHPRALEALNGLVKELSRKTLPVDRRAFREVGMAFFDVARSKLAESASQLGSQRQQDEQVLRLTVFWAKICGRLAIDGAFVELAERGSLDGFFTTLLGLEALELPNAAPLTIAKLRKRLSCTPRDALKKHVAAFERFAAPFVELACDRALKSGEDLFNLASVARLELLALAVDASRKSECAFFREFVARRGASLAAWFQESKAPLAMSRFELEEWESDPEDFALKDDASSDSSTVAADAEGARAVRRAAETLLLSLVEVEPSFGRRLAEAAFGSGQQQQQHHHHLEGSLRAAGICASEIVDLQIGAEDCGRFFFQKWCTETCIPALASLRQQQNKVLQRRLYWVVRCWAFVLKPAMLLALVAEAVQDAGASGDIVVRLEALSALKAIATIAGPRSWSEQLGEAATLSCLNLAISLSEPAHFEAAVRGARLTLRTTQNSTGLTVLAAVPGLLEHAQRIEAPPTASTAILNAATTALRRRRRSSSGGGGDEKALCVRLVAAFTDVTTDPELCSAQAAAALWLELLHSTTESDSDCLALLDRLPSLVQPPRDLELASHVASLATAYAAFGLDATAALGPMVGEVSARANKQVDRAMEMLLVASGESASRAILSRPALAQSLARSALDVTRTPDATIAQHLAVLARLMLLQPQTLQEALGPSYAAILKGILKGKLARADDYVSCVDESNDEATSAANLVAHRGKLAAAVLLAELPRLPQLLLPKLDDLLGRVAESQRRCVNGAFATQLARGPRLRRDRTLLAEPDEDAAADDDDFDDDDDDDGAQKTRLDALCEWRVGQDAVAALDLVAFARTCLEQTAIVVGQEALHEALSTVEPTTLAALNLPTTI